jgi:hypothetical protein
VDYLRDFIYLDEAKLYSFVSQIQGGIISEINETTKRLGGLSAGVNVGIPQLGAKADATKHKESEQQQTRTLTDPAYFGVLHQYLKKEKSLTDITEMSSEKISHLEVGQFVEMHGIAEPPVVEDWIRRLNSLFGFFEKNMKIINGLQGNPKSKSSTRFSNMEIRQFRAIIDLLVDYINLTRKDPAKQFIKITPDSQSIKVWCGLLPNYSLVPLHTVLPSNIWIFGRVDHYVEDSNPEKIVDLTMFNQTAKVDDLLEALNAINTLTGQNPIRETDFEAKHPDVFIVPVAMYQ